MAITPYLKHIAAEAGGGRPLSHQAASAVMAQVLDGTATAAQCGAFAMAMHLKGETLDELSGFLAAAQRHCLPMPSTEPVVLIPSYQGARHLPHLTPLLAAWLARQGVRVLMHGPLCDAEHVTSAEVLHDLGVAPVLDSADLERAWERREPAFVPTRLLCPPLQALLDLRRLIGHAGPGYHVARMLNPVVGAPALRLLHHSRSAFGTLMRTWVQRDGIDALLLRGTDGEPVADPRRQPRIETWLGGQLQADLCVPAQEGVLTELPLLPHLTDAATTALYVQEVLSGVRPVPAPLGRQAAVIVSALAALRARRIRLERSA